MAGTDHISDRSGLRLVVVDASVRTARTAHSLGCHTFFVQRPGDPVQELVDDFSGYYTVDFPTEPADRLGDDRTRPLGDLASESFTDFVEAILRPLAPTAVVSLSAAGALPAAVANSLLGTAGTPVELVRRLMATTRAGADADSGAGRELTAYTFSVEGVHRWVGVMDPHAPPVRRAHVVPNACLTPLEYDAVGSALTEFLDDVGLRNGPARVSVREEDRTVRITGAEPIVDDGEAELLRRLTGLDLTRWALGRPLGLRQADCTDLPRPPEAGS